MILYEKVTGKTVIRIKGQRVIAFDPSKVMLVGDVDQIASGIRIFLKTAIDNSSGSEYECRVHVFSKAPFKWSIGLNGGKVGFRDNWWELPGTKP